MSWLTSPPALIIGLLASLIGIGQALRGLTRRIILFPRLRQEQQFGHAVMGIMQAIAVGKRIPWASPPEEDWGKYKA
jgi:hypothetical protein